MKETSRPTSLRENILGEEEEGRIAACAFVPFAQKKLEVDYLDTAPRRRFLLELAGSNPSVSM